MKARSTLARARSLASGAYHRTVGEVVQRKRSRAYVAREQAKGRQVPAGLPVPAPRIPVTSAARIRAARARAARVPRARTAGRSRSQRAGR